MTCPICARPADPRYRPFCSRRCADVDLGKWLTGAYAVPAGAETDEDEDPAVPDGSPDEDTPPRPS